MDRREMEHMLKEIIFTEPEFSNFLNKYSHSTRSPFSSWVSDNSGEYTRYLQTQKTDDTNEVHEKTVQRIRESRDKSLHKFVKECFVDRDPPFYDLEIHVENKVYKVHRFIVAPFIPKIMKDLTDMPIESQVNGVVVDLSGIEANSVECIIKYIYTGEVKPTSNNFIDVLELAIRCEMKSFAERWVEAYESTKPLLALQLVFRSRLARKYGWKEYVDRINASLALQFENLILTEKFLRLEAPEFLEILREDEFGTHSEVVIYLSVIKWLHYDWSDRKKFAVHLMNEIRFNEMNKEELLVCYSPPVLKEVIEIPEINAMITDAILDRNDMINKRRRIYRKVDAPQLRLWISESEMNDLKTKFNIRSLQSDLDNKQAKSFDMRLYDRKPAPTADIESEPRKMRHYNIDASSSSSSDKTSKDYSPDTMRTAERVKYNFQLDFSNKDKQKEVNTQIVDKRIEVKPETPKLERKEKESEYKRQDQAVDTSPSTSSTLSSYPSTPDYLIKESVQPLPPVSDKQISPEEQPGVDMTLLVFGDYFGPKDQQTLFRWDNPNSSSVNWMKVSALPKNPEIPLDCSIINDSRNIYCVGGIDTMTENNELHLNASKKLYKYDFKGNQLIPLKDMKFKRVLHSTVFLNDSLYVIGGRSSKERASNTIDIYDSSGMYRKHVEMQTTRYGAACVVIKKRIFIFGGIKKSDRKEKYFILSDVIVFNPMTAEWSRMKAKLPIGIAFASAVVRENNIYVIGGRVKDRKSGKLQMSNTVYCFDGKKWFVHSRLNHSRCHIYCFAYKSNIFAIGGSTDKEPRVNVCECFDLNGSSNEWKVLKNIPVKTTGNMMTLIPSESIK